MTAIISWFTHDGKPGAASLYLASDSRFSRRRPDGTYKVENDTAQKVFTSKSTPDIFAFYGPTSGVQSLIGDLIGGAEELRESKCYGENAETEFPEELFKRTLNGKLYGVTTGLRVFHGYRFGTRRLGLTKVTFNAGFSPSFTVYPQMTKGGLLAREGSGEEMVCRKLAEYADDEAESKGYSRWFWMSFCASLKAGNEGSCGGAPQLAALYSRDGGQTLGTFYGVQGFVEGKPCARTDIEYRDELFQRVDAYGNLLPKAQRHARMGKPRIFDFAQ